MIAQSEVWSQRNAQRIAESKRKKNDCIFWRIFGFSPNLVLKAIVSKSEMIQCKGPFIATQLNSTRRRVELCRYKRAFIGLHAPSMDARDTSKEEVGGLTFHAVQNVQCKH